ncbi:MAG TPA: hypothetical protein V6D05_13265 [Stenomitos sp.]
MPILQANFKDAPTSLLDLAPLEACVKDEHSYETMVELVTLFGMRGFPFDAERLVEWHRLAIPPSTLYAVFELTRPTRLEDLDHLLDVLRVRTTSLRVEVLRPIASAYQALGRPLAIDNLGLALDTLGLAEGGSLAAFTAAAEAYVHIGPEDPRLDRLLLERLKDEEALAATTAMFDVVATHLGKVENYDDLRDLLEGVVDRITVRRIAKVLQLFEEFGVHVGVLDTFQLSFATTQGDIEWLERALKGLTELKRPIDRVALMQLREWAPELAALGRYLTAVRSFHGLGMSVDEIDKLVLKRAESEEQSQVLGLIGDLWFRLGFGELTLDRAEHLADILGDRPHLKRYETAVNLLRELKLSPTDVEALAEIFFETSDDINWLEAVLASAGDSEERLGRLQILHLRERCPDPPNLYRYFRLRRAFAWFQGDHASLDAWLVDIAPVNERTSTLLALADILQDSGRLTVDELKELEATYPTQDLLEAFGECVRTFNGDWRSFTMFLKQVLDSGDLQACFAILNRTFGEARMSGNRFERAFEYLVSRLGHHPVVSKTMVTKKEDPHS